MPQRELSRSVDGVAYDRLPRKTHVITAEDDIVEVADRYTAAERREGDIIVVAESPTAISQGQGLGE